MGALGCVVTAGGLSFLNQAVISEAMPLQTTREELSVLSLGFQGVPRYEKAENTASCPVSE
jgi:hypothetical protein